MFTFKKSSFVSDGGPLTKRNCLAYLTQLWDPMGLVAPATIEFRIDLQELWSAGYSWDEILPKESQTKWMENVQILNQLLKFEFSRKLKPDNAVGLPEIHGFCDGGEKALFLIQPYSSDGNSQMAVIPVYRSWLKRLLPL